MPAPLGPSTTRVSPALELRSTRSRAGTVVVLAARPASSIAGAGASPARGCAASRPVVAGAGRDCPGEPARRWASRPEPRRPAARRAVESSNARGLAGRAWEPGVDGLERRRRRGSSGRRARSRCCRLAGERRPPGRRNPVPTSANARSWSSAEADRGAIVKQTAPENSRPRPASACASPWLTDWRRASAAVASRSPSSELAGRSR